VAPIYFASPAALRRWLVKHHATAKELVVGLFKQHAGRPTITWPELVREALCFGWIDGIRRSVDADRYTIRITPRKPDSTWSRINVALVAELSRRKLMRAAGRKAFAARRARQTGAYSFENRPTTLSPSLKKPFQANRAAWAFYTAQPPGYRRITAFWVMEAKQAGTRFRRLARLIRDSAAGRRLGLLEASAKRRS